MTVMIADADRNRRKIRVGQVVSDRMDKTVVVSIERLVKHPVYGRYVRRRSKFKVSRGMRPPVLAK